MSILASVLHVKIVEFISILIATNSITEVPVESTLHAVSLAWSLRHLERGATESMKVKHSGIKDLRNYLFIN